MILTQPEALVLILSFGFGIIIGSFLNVVIYRLHTGRSLKGHSHCLSCGKRLRYFELFPLISYLILMGKCRNCRSHIPIRYFLVELITGILFVLSAFVTTVPIETAILWVVMSIVVVIVVYDLYHYIIPDELVGFLLLAVGTYLVWHLKVGLINFDILLSTIFAALLGSLFLFLLWLISKGQGIGFGDVKLVIPLGLLVGPSLVFSMMVWSFWLGAGISLLMLGAAKLARGKLGLRFLPGGLTMKSAVPFAPFLVAGTLLVFFTKNNVLNLFTF